MNRQSVERRILPAAVLLMLSNSVAALDYHVSGFGTASLSCFTNDTADFVINDQPEGPGRTRTCDGGTDSLLGVQFDLDLLKSLEIGVQVVGNRNENRDYLPTLMIAQMRWHPTDNLTFRLGRAPSPAFLYSESRLVRYGLPWVRPPLEVYGLFPTYSNDGLEFIHKKLFGNWQAEWHGGMTQVSFDTPISNTKDTTPFNAYGGFLNLSLERSNTLIKLGYGYYKVTYNPPDTNKLVDFLRTPLFSEGQQLADDLAVDESSIHLFAVGVRHEYADWLVMGEFSHRLNVGFVRNQYGAYLTVGRHFDSWMPYATIARRWTSGPNNDVRAGFLQPQVAYLLAATRYDTTSAALGLSHDINDNIKLKLQTDWIRPDDNSWGLYTNHAPDYNYSHPGSDWLFTMNLDFVF
jgi:hypothetical protein